MGQKRFFFNKKIFFKKTKSKDSYLLILDIGTEFVKSLVVKIPEDVSGIDSKIDQGMIIGAGWQRQAYAQMQAGAVADIDGVAATCGRAIELAVAMAKIRPKRVVVGIAGEFIKGATTNFLYQRAKPAGKIDLTELQNVILKIQWRAFDRIRSQLARETGKPEIEIKPINALISEMRIDNHPVVNPVGFQGKEVFLNIFNVYAPLVHLRAVESIVDKLGLELASIVAEPYALTRISGFNPTAGAIFVDVGGGTTDIALVRRSGVEGIKSFALAGRVFTNRLSQVFDLGKMQAEQIKVKYAYAKLGSNVCKKINHLLKSDLLIWLNGLELALEEFAEEQKDGAFPSLILFCGGGSLLPGIRDIIKTEIINKRWLDKFPFVRLPQIRFIRSEHIKSVVDKTNMLFGPEHITPMALAGLGLEILADEKKPVPFLLKRAIRLIQ